MLKLESLPIKTKKVFELLRNREELKDFVLIGGTALSLQLNHRQSEDLDFWAPNKTLNRYQINKLVTHLKSSGHQVVMVTPASMISQARINGFDLLDSVQDWSVDGVKMTFFSRIDTSYSYFSQKRQLDKCDTQTAFSIMSADGIFAMKAYVLSKRITSRDLYDLKSLIEQGRPIDALFREAIKADPSISVEHLKDVLTGVVPLDDNDAGFESIGLNQKIEDLYAFFDRAVNAMEIAAAQRCKHAGHSGPSFSG
jgi:hypothetical protein